MAILACCSLGSQAFAQADEAADDAADAATAEAAITPADAQAEERAAETTAPEIVSPAPVAPVDITVDSDAGDTSLMLAPERLSTPEAIRAAADQQIVEVPQPEIGPTETTLEACDDSTFSDRTALERVRRRLTITACASSAWLDSLFGDQLHYDEYRATYGSVSAGTLWSEYDGFDPRLRFRARLQLPQWNERISAFASRVSEEDFVTDTEGDFEALPTRQFGGLDDESVLVGLGYSSPTRTGNDFDAGVGVRVDLPLDPFAQVRYEIVRTFAERYVFRARETVFWRNSEGLGSTTRFNIDRALSNRFLLRWNNVAKFTEETNGVEWVSETSLFQSIGARTGLAWQGYVTGVTDNEVPFTRYGARLIMRRQLQIEWLFLEVRGGLSWPRQRLTEQREMSPEAGIALEMQFGRKDRRKGI